MASDGKRGCRCAPGKRGRGQSSGGGGSQRASPEASGRAREKSGTGACGAHALEPRGAVTTTGQRGRVATHGRGATASERELVWRTATATTRREGDGDGAHKGLQGTGQRARGGRRGRRRRRGGSPARWSPATASSAWGSFGEDWWSEAATMAFRRRSGGAGQPGDDAAASGPGVGLGGKGIGVRCVGAPPIQIARAGEGGRRVGIVGKGVRVSVPPGRG